MTLIRTSLLNGVAVLVRMITLLGINKIMAIYIGPVGYAIVGQFYNAVQMITTFASGAINTGVVKYTAEHFDDEASQREVWKTAGTIAILGSCFSAILIALFNKPLASIFLKDESLSGVFLWFAGSLPFFTLNAFLLAILNGKKEVKKYVIANIAGSFFSFLLTGWLAYSYKLYGALIALGIYQSFSCIVTVLICLKTDWFKISFLFGKINKKVAFKLASYTLMALTTAVCLPLSHILIRDYLGSNLGWPSAGLWESMWKFSSAYLMLVTTTLSVYYLPRISELKNKDEVCYEIWRCFKIILPFVVLSSIGIFHLRDFIITLLFTKEFLSIRSLFFWQLIGDTFKIASWLFSFVFLAKGFTRYYIFSEVIFSITFYFLIILLVPYYGLEATAISHAVNYSGYLIYVYWVLKREGYVK